MSVKMKTSDPVILGSHAALRRAAKRARRLAEETGTPFYILRDGKVVNANPKSNRGSLKAKRTK